MWGCFLFLFKGASATTWQTVNYGYWNSAAIWSGGVPPPYTTPDTLLILHPVVIENDLVLNYGAYLFIDSTGGICGHKKTTVNSGAKIMKYGILELDTLAVPGGNVICSPPGSFILTEYGIISNGGSMTITSGVNVGPWFECRSPEYFFAPVNELQPELSMKVVYNNSIGHELKIKNNKNGRYVMISDAFGRQTCKIKLMEGNNSIGFPDYLTGVYFVKIVNKNYVGLLNGKFIVLN